jgi:hypothetical protein
MEEECNELPEKPSVLKRCRRYLNKIYIKEEKLITVLKLRSKL